MTDQITAGAQTSAEPGELPVRRLWLLATGQAVSMLGSSISLVAVPLVALQTLHAAAWQVGLLSSLGMMPNLLVGIPAGVLAARREPRSLLQISDLARLALIGSVTGVMWLHLLTFWYLAFAVFTVGCFGVLFDTTMGVYIPRLVGLGQLVSGLSGMQAAQQAGAVCGQSIGGYLSAAFGPAHAVLGDASTFLVSFWTVRRLPRCPVDSADLRAARQRGALTAGLRIIMRYPISRSLISEAAYFNFGVQLFSLVFTVYVIEDLHWADYLLGLATAGASLGIMIGSVASPRISRHLGVGRTIIGALIAGDLGALLVAVPPQGGPFAQTVQYGAAFTVIGVGAAVSGVLSSALFRAAVPRAEFPLAAGASRVLTRGTAAFGGLVGGTFMAWTSPRDVLVGSAAWMAAAIVWVLRRDILRVREITDVVPSPTSPGRNGTAPVSDSADHGV